MMFEPGTIVQLKSGGSALTVATCDGTTVTCVWQADQTGEIHTATIPAVCLDELLLDDDEDDLDEE
jgi:uncharacterized protein YodC (DUF2158 family)